MYLLYKNTLFYINIVLGTAQMDCTSFPYSSSIPIIPCDLAGIFTTFTCVLFFSYDRTLFHRLFYRCFFLLKEIAILRTEISNIYFFIPLLYKFLAFSPNSECALMARSNVTPFESTPSGNVSSNSFRYSS